MQGPSREENYGSLLDKPAFSITLGEEIKTTTQRTSSTTLHNMPKRYELNRTNNLETVSLNKLLRKSEKAGSTTVVEKDTKKRPQSSNPVSMRTYRQRPTKYDDCGLPTTMAQNGEDFGFLSKGQITRGGAQPSENLRFMGMLRARAFGDRKFSHQVGAYQDDDTLTKAPQSTMPNPPSFYEQDVESFLSKKGASRNAKTQDNSYSTATKIKLSDACLKQNYNNVSFLFY